MGGIISPMHSGCGTSLLTWEIHHPESPLQINRNLRSKGTRKWMPIADAGPFQHKTRFKISGTGTGSETCHVFLFGGIQDFRFQPTICQHYGIDHLKPKEQTCFKGVIADTSRHVAFVQLTKKIKHVQHKRLNCIHFNYSEGPLSLQVGPQNAGSNQLVGRYYKIYFYKYYVQLHHILPY